MVPAYNVRARLATLPPIHRLTYSIATHCLHDVVDVAASTRLPRQARLHNIRTIDIREEGGHGASQAREASGMRASFLLLQARLCYHEWQTTCMWMFGGISGGWEEDAFPLANLLALLGGIGMASFSVQTSKRFTLWEEEEEGGRRLGGVDIARVRAEKSAVRLVPGALRTRYHLPMPFCYFTCVPPPPQHTHAYARCCLVTSPVCVIEPPT